LKPVPLNKSPFAKLGLGWTHHGSRDTRLKPARYSLDAEPDSVLTRWVVKRWNEEQRQIPYAELTFLWNTVKCIAILGLGLLRAHIISLGETPDMLNSQPSEKDEVRSEAGCCSESSVKANYDIRGMSLGSYVFFLLGCQVIPTLRHKKQLWARFYGGRNAYFW